MSRFVVGIDLGTTNSALAYADTAEAIILMQQNQTALQAALQATAMLDDLNLAKFL